MLRILVVWILSALLAGCSGSSRLEEICPRFGEHAAAA
jgi:hypothetical protein